MLYSLVFTSIPIVLLGVFDQDVDAVISLAYPLLYKRGIAGLEYTKTIFWVFILDGLYQSVSAKCLFREGVSLRINRSYAFSSRSRSMGIRPPKPSPATTALPWQRWAPASPSAPSSLQIVSQTSLRGDTKELIPPSDYTGLLTKYWTKLYVTILVISSLLSILWVVIYSEFPYQLKSIDVVLFSTANFFGSVILIQVLCLMPRYLYMYIQQIYYPRDTDIIRELAGAQL